MRYRNKSKIVHILNYLGFRFHVGAKNEICKCVAKDGKQWSIPVFSRLKNRQYRFYIEMGKIYDT